MGFVSLCEAGAVGARFQNLFALNWQSVLATPPRHCVWYQTVSGENEEKKKPGCVLAMPADDDVTQKGWVAVCRCFFFFQKCGRFRRCLSSVRKSPGLWALGGVRLVRWIGPLALPQKEGVGLSICLLLKPCGGYP